MSKLSPEPKNGLTPIDEADSRVTQISGTQLNTVREGSAKSFLSDTSSCDTNYRKLSSNSVRPIIASATQLHPGTVKTNKPKGSSKKLRYVLIALGIFFIIAIIVVLACIPLYLPKKSTATSQTSTSSK